MNLSRSNLYNNVKYLTSINLMPGLSKYRARLVDCKNYLASQVWFPQVPLAIAVALIGLMYLFPLLTHQFGWQFIANYSSLNLNSFNIGAFRKRR
ncbi:hypothetical protein BMETH_1210_0 [methanotrophic bacterial endosymbiont of Bathymodiolus sp.]|nr:hypothetical protein BMETH_1210_0 [methanotrophic bacterial endosymbiont of Bathymodiolus sp.]